MQHLFKGGEIIVWMTAFLLLTVDGWSHRKYYKRIIGGDNASPAKFPWAVAIKGDIHHAKVSTVCGATVVSERWLLTAAHCFYNKNPHSDFVLDLRDPSLWHITAGQLLVNLAYEDEKQLHENQLPSPPSMDQSSDNYLTNEPPSWMGDRSEQINYLQQECGAIENTTKLSNEAVRNCWELLYWELSQNDGDENAAELPELCEVMEVNSHRLALLLEQCRMKINEWTKPEDISEGSSKRYFTSMANAYSHYHVEKIFIHYNYEPDDLEYDIALIKLDNPLPFRESNGVSAINLPRQSVENDFPLIGTSCVIVGWGCTKPSGEANPVAKFTELEILSNNECNHVYTNQAGLSDEHEFCAGFVNQNIGICPGDSGSGLVCSTGANNWTIAGITSATHSNEPGNYPGLFTRVSYFVDWIHAIMKKH